MSKRRTHRITVKKENSWRGSGRKRMWTFRCTCGAYQGWYDKDDAEGSADKHREELAAAQLTAEAQELGMYEK